MRILICGLLFVLQSVAIPNSDELRKRYGPPDTSRQSADSEHFTLRPGFTLTVQYGADHRACQLVVERFQPLHEQQQAIQAIPPAYVAVLVQEISSLAATGAKVGDVSLPSVRVIDFEDARILETIRDAFPSRGVIRITEFLKRDVCPASNNPVQFFEETVLPLTPNVAGLRNRYGLNKPEADFSSDVFALLDLKLSVQYGSDRRACHIHIEPLDPLNRFVPSREVSELIDSLAPIAMRGMQTSSGEMRSSVCGGIVFERYENIQINRIPNFCDAGHPNTDTQATINFLREECH